MRRVVDENVQSAQLLDGAVDDRLAEGGVTEIALENNAPVAFSFNRALRLL